MRQGGGGDRRGGGGGGGGDGGGGIDGGGGGSGGGGGGEVALRTNTYPRDRGFEEKFCKARTTNKRQRQHSSPATRLPPPIRPRPCMISNTSPPSTLYIWYLHIGWVGDGWRGRGKTRLSPRALDNQGAVLLLFIFWRSPRLAVELDHFCAGRTFAPHKGDDRIT